MIQFNRHPNARTVLLDDRDAPVYFASPGDTLESIARQLGGPHSDALEALRALNPGLAADAPVGAGSMVLLPSTPISPRSAPPTSPVETSWERGYGRSLRSQNAFNAEIAAARDRWADLPPEILKSVLAQESGFRPLARNRYGYGGIAQLGVAEARSVGLETGSSQMRISRRGIAARFDLKTDQRFDPRHAIAGAAALLRMKAEALERGLTTRNGTRLDGFGALGEPAGDDYWRFVTAAYNGGEGTVLWALHYAYGNVPPGEVRWEDLVRGQGGDARSSPLWRAIVTVGMNPFVKYEEISTYARDVVLRARQ